MTAERLTVARALRGTGLEPVDARLLLQHALGLEHAGLISKQTGKDFLGHPKTTYRVA
jgi:hypothetical protein